MSELVLQDLELCQQLEPIMKRYEIEPDGWLMPPSETNYETLICIPEVTAKWSCIRCYRQRDRDIERTFTGPDTLTYWEPNAVPTYRADKLELVLPDWVYENKLCFIRSNVSNAESLNLIPLVSDLIIDIRISRGQAKLEALAKLIILLDESGLLEKK